MTNGLTTTDPLERAESPLRGEALIARAIDAGLPVESLERLMALRDRLRAEEAEAAFTAALSQFQGECPIIPKTKTVTVRPQSGSAYSYAFAPIEEIMRAVGPLLGKHGLAVTSDTVLEETRITYVATVHHVGGHALTSTFAVPLEAGRMSKQHAVASANTYASRYAIRNALGIFTGDEDDDAAGAAGLLSQASTRRNGEVTGPQAAVVAPPPPRRKGAAPVVSEPAGAPLVVTVPSTRRLPRDLPPEPDHTDEARVLELPHEQYGSSENAGSPLPDLVQRVAADLSLEDTLRASRAEGDAPLAEPERMALYGQIRLLLRGHKIAGTPDNLQRAKTAVKVWLARELGVEHLEDIPQKHLARVRAEVPRLVEEAFTQ